MTTTYKAIRQQRCADIAGLTPTLLNGTRFREARHELPFRRAVEANPAGCMREFTFVLLANRAEGLTQGTIETRVVEVEFLIAYPYELGRYGAGEKENLISLDDVIVSDMNQICGKLGQRYFGTFVSGQRNQTGDAWEVEHQDSTAVVSMPMEITYDRDPSA